ncbi:MAG: hypothetical protein DHS20C18_08320 [Saprospiraceae bacterium]|nr:MAG: hypothetical protein DHS20C18_08320 [Saprospiraceae bacterium]
MQKSRVFELFDTFSKKEIRHLKKFIASPFFNQRAHVIALFHYLVRCKFQQKIGPTPEKAFEYLFPKQIFDDHKLRLSMSLLHKVFEKYLIWQEVNKEEIRSKIKLARAFRELNLSRHFLKTIAELKNMQTNQAHHNADFYQNQYELFLEEYLFHSEQSRMGDLNLQQVQENLDNAYITSKLRQSCFLLSHQNIYKKQYDFGMLPQMLAYVEQHSLLDKPAISVYYYCYHTLVEPNEYKHFEKFKTLIFKYQSHFPKGEIRDLFLLATNYCIRLMNQGEKRFAKEGLSIYKEGLKNEALLLNGVLSHFTYRNIVAKAIVSKDFDWAEGFIHNYKAYLAEKYRQSTFSFNLAWLEYERKNYDKALQLLNKANFTDLLLNLSAKTIAMKIYYELEAFDLLYAHLEAMKKFITRKDIIAYHKKNYLNTIKFTKKILDLPITNRAIKKQLSKEIESTAAVAEKNWLLACLK